MSDNSCYCNFCGSPIGEYAGYCGAVCLTAELQISELRKKVEELERKVS